MRDHDQRHGRPNRTRPWRPRRADRRDGYTILRAGDVPDTLDALAADLARLERRLDVQPANSFEGTPHAARSTTFSTRARVWEQVPVHPGRAARGGGRARSRKTLVSSLKLRSRSPRARTPPQPIHADDQLMPLVKPHVPTVCNTMWALTDFTEANGATRLVPGSHLADCSPDYGKPYDSVAAGDAQGSACSCGTARCGTAAAPTTPPSDP